MIHSIRALDKTDRLRWEELFQNYAEFYELNIPGGGFDRVWDWTLTPKTISGATWSWIQKGTLLALFSIS
jgi:hypothetical protein